MRTTMTPLGAVIRGIAAGAAGAFAIGAVLKATAKVMPQPAPDAFTPPDEKQKQEQPTETVARRLVEDFMRRGPIDETTKATGGQLVHIGFGAAWGGLYGLLHGSHRFFRGPLGALAFGAGVWAASDLALLPAFKLAPPGHKQPPGMHLMMLLGHLVYGEATWAAFEGSRSRTWLPILAPVAARWAVRNVPRFARPAAYRVIEAVNETAPRRRARDVARLLAAVAT